MQITVASGWALAVLLLTLRLTPLLAFAPPFTLLNIPVRIRVLIVLMLAACLAQGAFNSGSVVTALALPLDLGALSVMAAGELVLGLGFAFAFQAAFAALYFAGRVLDLQSGFGMATVLDPATRAQSPLIGTFLVFGAAAVFFAVDGHHALLRVIAASLQLVPIGSVGEAGDAAPGWAIDLVIAHSGLIFAVGLLIAGTGVAVLFLTDLALAFLSRSLPQMNILLIGMQVKIIVLIFTLILMSGVLLPLFLRVTESGLQFIEGIYR